MALAISSWGAIRQHGHPARLTTGEAVDDAWDKVDLLSRVHLPRLRDAANRAAAAAGLPAPQTIDQILSAGRYHATHRTHARTI